MRYCGLSIWPPRWSPVEAPGQKVIWGELGTLKRVAYSAMAPHACHLFIEYQGREYLGTLLMDDATFCRQLYYILQYHTTRSIEQIGVLDLSYTL
jgi:hypothetical protein